MSPLFNPSILYACVSKCFGIIFFIYSAQITPKNTSEKPSIPAFSWTNHLNDLKSKRCIYILCPVLLPNAIPLFSFFMHRATRLISIGVIKFYKNFEKSDSDFEVEISISFSIQKLRFLR